MSLPPQGAGGGGAGGGVSLSQLQTELNNRNVDLTHMNRIDENVSDPKQIDITTANGTYVHPNVTTEQDVLEFVGNNENIEVTLDFTELTQTSTVRVYEKTDGTNYRVISSATYPADFDGADIVIELNGKDRDQKITLQSSLAEGTTRNIPHSRVEELRA